MRDSLHALLAESLDYAGLFPPAQLPLREAFRKHVQYQETPNAWLLSRFVCPAARLDELGDCVAVEDSPQVVRLSVLGRRSEGDPAHTSAALHADCERMRSFVTEHRERVSLEFYETALSPSLPDEGTALARFVAQVREALASHELAPQGVFFEVPASLRDAAALAIAQPSDARPTCGLKLRMGRLEASAFPQANQLAQFIVACREAVCRWKATAGLHHPLSADVPALGVWHCGFLNLFAAAVLSHAHALSLEQVDAILQEQKIDAFQFNQASFSWRDYAVANQQIAAARREALISFGSCSFDEPVDGLARLHLLEE